MYSFQNIKKKKKQKSSWILRRKIFVDVNVREENASLNPREIRQKDRKSEENTRSPKSPNGCPYIWRSLRLSKLSLFSPSLLSIPPSLPLHPGSSSSPGHTLIHVDENAPLFPLASVCPLSTRTNLYWNFFAFFSFLSRTSAPSTKRSPSLRISSILFTEFMWKLTGKTESTRDRKERTEQ